MAQALIKINANSSEYQRAMKQAAAEMKNLTSEYSLAEAQAKLYGSESDALQAKIKELTSKIEKQSDIVETNKVNAQNLTSELNKQKDSYEKIGKKVDETREKYAESCKATGENSEESKKLKDELDSLEAQYKTTGAKIQDTESKLTKAKGTVTQSEAALEEMRYELQEVNAELARQKFDEYAEKAEKVGGVVTDVGKKLSIFSMAVVGAATDSTKRAIEFESAFAGVKKTVDATDEQLEELKGGIVDMSKQLPASTTEIAAVAEAAGQLGIATEDILSFTRTMIDLGESTNLSSDEAASALAKFANVVKMDADNYGALGSTIVALGNNFATTEADIVSMATRLASTGEVVGLSEAQIMAISTALSAVGIEAEAGGSAISKLLKQMEVAVQMYGTATEAIDATGHSLRDLELMSSLDSAAFKEVAGSLGLTTSELQSYMKNASQLEQFADVAGMTAEQFIGAWGEDAVGALSMFIGGLNDTERTGKSAVELLNDMGLTEVRLSNAVLSLASSDGVMTDALEIANKAWDENDALTHEAEQRYETTESRIAIMKNTVSALAAQFGEKLLPFVEDVVNKIAELANKFSGLSDEQQDTILKVGAVIAAIGPLLTVVGKLITFSGSVAKGLGTLSGIMSKISFAASGASGSTGLLSGALSAIASPVGLVVAALAALVAGLVYVAATNEDVQASLGNVAEIFRGSLSEAFNFVSETVLPDLQRAWDGLMEILEPLKEFVVGALTSAWQDILIPALEYLGGTIIPRLTATAENLWNNVLVPLGEFVGSVLQPVIKILSDLLTQLWQKVIVPLADAVGGVFGAAWEGVNTLFNEVIIPQIKRQMEFWQNLWNNVLSPIVQWLYTTLKPMFQTTFETIGNVIGGLKTAFIGIIDFIVGVFTLDLGKAGEGLKGIFGGIWDSIKATFSGTLEQIGNWASLAWDGISAAAIWAWSGISDFFVRIWESISGWFSSALSTISSALSSAWSAISETISSVWSGIANYFSNIWNGIKSTASNLWGKIKSVITNPIESAKTALSNTTNGIKSTLSKAWDGIKSTASNVWGKIKSAITSPIEKAKETIKGIIDKLKGMFNFEWSLPKIKLPHIKIEGEFSLSPPSVPHLSIEWYKSGGIMTRPTVFGGSGTSLFAGGEAGDEAILPLAPFYERLSEILDKALDESSQTIRVYVRVVNSIDGEIISEKTYEAVADKIVKEYDRRR